MNVVQHQMTLRSIGRLLGNQVFRRSLLVNSVSRPEKWCLSEVIHSSDTKNQEAAKA